MACVGGHLGFLIHTKNADTVRDHPMIIHVQFGVSLVFEKSNLFSHRVLY